MSPGLVDIKSVERTHKLMQVAHLQFAQSTSLNALSARGFTGVEVAPHLASALALEA